MNEPAPSAGTAVAYDRRHGIGCAVVSVLIGLTQSLTVYGVNNNLGALQGALGATAVEASWLSTAYFATALSAIVLMTKLRLQFGLDRFAVWSIVAFALVSVGYAWAPSLGSAIALRVALGLAAAPLNTLAILYMVEAMPQALAPVGLVLGFATLQFGSPLGRIVAEPLLQLSPATGLQIFDLALAFATLAGILAVPLRPPPRQQVFSAGDIPAFVLYASGLALLCIVVTQGRARWWTDTPWLGACLAAAIVCLGAFVFVELNRARPLIDLRWVANPTMRRFVPAVLLFRIALSEQPTGAVGLMNVLGFTNDQLHVLFGWVIVGTALGFAAAVVALVTRRIRLSLLAALALVVLASLLDADATSLTRAHDIVLSQGLIAAATAMFLAASLVLGLMPVIQDGMRNLVSFLAMFSGAQNMGSLLGSAWLGTYVSDRQKLHLVHLAETLSLDRPLVASRAAQGAALQAGVIVDPAQRAAAGVAALGQQAAREAWVLAYDDLFRRVALVAALTFAWLAVYWVARWWRARTAPAELAPA
jgi:MFS family permease